MGLFSSKYVTQVGTSVSRVIKDDLLPQSVRTGVIKSIFEDGNAPDYVMEELAASVSVRAENMYSYAERSYTHGLPSGEIYSSTQGRQQVEAIIETAENQQVAVEYSYYGPANTLHIAWMKLVSQYGYNQATNVLGSLTAQKGTSVYLKNMVVVVPQSEASTINRKAIEQWGTAARAGFTPERTSSEIGYLVTPTPVRVSNTATELHVEVSYVWLQNGDQLQEATFIITVSEFDEAAEFFHAKYVANNQVKYWMYQRGLGTYPTLDSVYVNGPEVSGEYFPFTYFRYNKQSVIQDKTTQAYKTSKKLVKYLGMDYDMIAETIDENPDIADVEQAMMVFAVPATSTNEIECRYLFDYFNTLHAVMGARRVFRGDATERFLRSSQDNAIVIQDAQFKMALVNAGIYKQIQAGTIGAVGSHTADFYTTSRDESYTDSEGVAYTVSAPVRVHRYRKQITEGLYEEISVRELRMTYYVFGDYTTTGDETDDILLIPIDRSVTKTYSLPDREELYARSLHFVFNSRVVTKVKWYQTGVFKVVMLIIAIAITVYTYGADGGSAIASALSLSGTAGLIATIVVNLVIGQLLVSVFKLFVKAFGVEVAQILAIIAAIYGAYQIFARGMAALPTASTMLQMSSGLSQAVIQSKFSDLLEQVDELKQFVEEQTKLLDTAKELLENSNLLQPFVIFGEQPQDFYNRTVHFGNIGTLGITAVSSYVDIALTLPKINDTLGENLDVVPN